VTVTDPATGLLPTNLVQGGVAVSWLTADANSRYSFSCDVPGVVVDFGAGSQTLYANEVPGLAIAAGGATTASIDARMKWSGPGTVYALGQQILSPNSDVVKANVAHTSSAAYATDVAKWTLSTTWSATFAQRSGHGFPVVEYLPSGVTMGTASDAQMHAAFAAACVAAGSGMVILPPTELRVVGSFSMAGCSCSLAGTGSQIAPGYVTSGSVIKAVTQTGPVLDFTGYLTPYDFMARPYVGDFMVKGDGTSGTAKKGVYFPASTGGWTIRNIGILATGGVGLDMVDCYLGLVDNVIVSTPVSCVTNNVPYARFTGCNGMNVKMGFRSTLFSDSDLDVPADGVLATRSSAAMFHRGKFECWFENMHLGTGKSCVVAQTNQCIYSDFLYFDIKKVTGATGTSYFRFEPSGVSDSGGNIYRGIVEGDFNGGANYPDFGVDVLQSWNRIEGVKGYRGNNVRLNAGVGNTFVSLGGRAGNATTAAVVDNSGVTTNVLSGAWTTYTPVLTAATNPTLGTGSTVVGSRYTVDSNAKVTYTFDIKFGTSGAAAGSGSYNVSLPVTGASAGGAAPLGVVWVTANGLTTAAVALFNGTDAIRLQYLTAAVNGTPTYVGAAAPGVFTNNDEIRGTVIYQAALI